MFALGGRRLDVDRETEGPPPDLAASATPGVGLFGGRVGVLQIVEVRVRMGFWSQGSTSSQRHRRGEEDICCPGLQKKGAFRRQEEKSGAPGGISGDTLGVGMERLA